MTRPSSSITISIDAALFRLLLHRRRQPRHLLPDDHRRRDLRVRHRVDAVRIRLRAPAAVRARRGDLRLRRLRRRRRSRRPTDRGTRSTACAGRGACRPCPDRRAARSPGGTAAPRAAWSLRSNEAFASRVARRSRSRAAAGGGRRRMPARTRGDASDFAGLIRGVGGHDGRDRAFRLAAAPQRQQAQRPVLLDRLAIGDGVRRRRPGGDRSARRALRRSAPTHTGRAPAPTTSRPPGTWPSADCANDAASRNGAMSRRAGVAMVLLLRSGGPPYFISTLRRTGAFSVTDTAWRFSPSCG